MDAHPFQLGTVGIASTHRTDGDDLLAIDTDEKLATALAIGLANRVEIIVPRTTSAMCARMLQRQVVQLSDRLTVLVSISAENHCFIVPALGTAAVRRCSQLLLSEGGSLRLSHPAVARAQD